MKYVVGLDFDTEPDYDKCRDIFKAGLKKRKYPFDGKIDFSAPKTPAKKVGKSSTPAKSPSKKAAATPKVKATAKVKAATPASTKKATKTPVVKGGRVTKVKKYKDSSSQTSPAFVKAAKAAKERQRLLEQQKQEGLASGNEEMDEFVDKAKKAARAASSRGKKKAEDDDTLENLTADMKKIMAKKRKSPTKSKKTGSVSSVVAEVS